MAVARTPAPIIVTAILQGGDQAFLDALRRAHFPPERNHLLAHLTMFHHLAPSLERELRDRLAVEALSPAPRAELAGPMNLGRGVAYRVASRELEAIRERIADAFAGSLTPQDQAGWRPHVTVQNKVEPSEAKRLMRELAAGFVPRRLGIAGLGVFAYRGGPWEELGRYPFRGHRSP